MPSVKLLVLVGGPYHDGPGARDELLAAIAAHCDASVTITDDRSVFASLRPGDYDCVLVYTTSVPIEPAEESGLLDFVTAGGGFVGLHGATTSFKTSTRYYELIGSQFVKHPPFTEFAVAIADRSHPITRDVPNFNVPDEFYILEMGTTPVHVLATSQLDDQTQPTAYTTEFGQGRVYYLALGHDARCLRLDPVRRLLGQGITWAARK